EADQLTNYLRDSRRYRPPGAETLEAAWERMLQAAEQIVAAHPSEHLAIVGHGGSLRVLLCDALNAPLSSLQRLWLDNASLSIIEERATPERSLRRVTLLNDTHHLKTGADA